MRELSLILSGIALLVAPAAAEACRVSIPLEQRVEAWHAQHLFTAVAIVEVSETQMLEDPWGTRAVWAKQGHVLASQGSIEPGDDFEFADSLSFWSCGWVNNVEAQVGNRLAVYVTRSSNGTHHVFMALPLVEAMQIDSEIMSLAVLNKRVGPPRL